jgi:uncharacterized protein (DUF58 family)
LSGIDPDAENVAPLLESGETSTRISGIPREGKLWLLSCFLMLVTGLLKGINLLILLSYLLIGVWVVNRQMVRRDLRRVAGRRLPSDPVFAGKPAQFQMEISATAGSPIRGLTIQDQARDYDRAWIVLRLEPNHPVRIRWEFVFPSRGRQPVEPLRALTRFPFGLICRSTELSPATDLLVLPQLGAVNIDRLRQMVSRVARGDGRLRQKLRRTSAQGVDIHGLRDYRFGDSQRLIHWRTSARRGQLLVREFEDDVSLELVLVVDPRLPIKPNETDQARVEKVISMAATICKEWCRDMTARLTLVVVQPSMVVLTASTGPEFALRALETLSLAQGHSAPADQNWLAQLPHGSRMSPVLVLSTGAAMTLADEVSVFLGRPAVCVDADAIVPWYQPPMKDEG